MIFENACDLDNFKETAISPPQMRLRCIDFVDEHEDTVMAALSAVRDVPLPASPEFARMRERFAIDVCLQRTGLCANVDVDATDNPFGLPANMMSGYKWDVTPLKPWEDPAQVMKEPPPADDAPAMEPRKRKGGKKKVKPAE